jgi:hypothetical protein
MQVPSHARRANSIRPRHGESRPFPTKVAEKTVSNPSICRNLLPPAEAFSASKARSARRIGRAGRFARALRQDLCIDQIYGMWVAWFSSWNGSRSVDPPGEYDAQL